MKPGKLARKVFWKRPSIYICAVVIGLAFAVLTVFATIVEVSYLATLEGEALADNQGLEMFIIIIEFMIVPASVLAFFVNAALSGSEKKMRLKLNDAPTEQRMEEYRVFRRQYIWYLLGCLAVGAAAISITLFYRTYVIAVVATSLLLAMVIIFLMVSFIPAPAWEKNRKRREEDRKERKELIL